MVSNSNVSPGSLTPSTCTTWSRGMDKRWAYIGLDRRQTSSLVIFCKLMLIRFRKKTSFDVFEPAWFFMRLVSESGGSLGLLADRSYSIRPLWQIDINSGYSYFRSSTGVGPRTDSVPALHSRPVATDRATQSTSTCIRYFSTLGADVCVLRWSCIVDA